MQETKNKIFCIVGEAYSGKDKLVNDLCKSDPKFYTKVCSYTTRPKKRNEVEGVDHYFVSVSQFRKIRYEHRNEVVAYSNTDGIDQENQVYGYEYLTLLSDLKKSKLYVVDPLGLNYLKEHFYGSLDIVSIYIFAPKQQREFRACGVEGPKMTNFKQRTEVEHRQFEVLKNTKAYDYIIYNFNGLETNSLLTLKNIIRYETFRNNSEETNIYFNNEIYKDKLSACLSIIKDMELYYSHMVDDNYIKSQYKEYFDIVLFLILEKINQLP